MEPITWNDDFKVGVEQLDEQHRQLIQILNRLISKPQATTGSETISELLNDMMNYSKTHFETEENFLRQCNYPHLDEQIAQHRAFRKKNVDFCTATMQKDKTVPKEILHYLHDWWMNHILKSDMKYKPFLNKQKPYNLL